ncbi:glutamyl-tRNA synthetase [Balneicella halophila]|uniref:Glutamate--tRNA ligase n=1 Tax=Balneicella halophila TaxID=1537566 RepID=A0A7L4UQV2_BALHA|nr:glutamate--tRNA ligase [Balneicella halophila]PVX51892.1 glutamyl-tRNA synthetase [Balneicella halophila]
MTQKVRVRFAPSPTGALHIGGVRTALYNYLFAKKHGGDFILRIEDTDQTRYVEGAEEYIQEALKWSGLKVDEGVGVGGPHAPYRQSERKELYRQYSDQLLESGNAYLAFDTPEELAKKRQEAEQNKEPFIYNSVSRNQMRNSISLSCEETQKLLDEGAPYVVRFKIPEDETLHLKDIVRGDMSVNTSTLDDKVLFKSDGLPTYHLANIVDDHLMEISHVIRGEEWLPSLPLHVLLYRALGWENSMPEFAHLSLILKPVGKGKLSKRDGEKMGFPVFPLAWEESAGYREDGYFPEAFVNMLALLGWNPGTEQELFTMEELIEAFDLSRVSKSGAKFDPEKVKWFNHQYLIKKTDEEIASLFMPILEEKGISISKDKLTAICGEVKERVSFVSELWEQTDFYFQAPEEFDEKAVKKQWKENTANILQSLLDEVIVDSDDFSSANLEAKVKEWITNEELGMGKVMAPFRIAMVGGLRGPHLFDITEQLGKDETIARLKYAIEKLA